MSYVILYNPENNQLDRIREFFTPIIRRGAEIIAEVDVEDEDKVEEMEEWLRDWTFSTEVVARILNEIEEPRQRRFFRDVYPSSSVTDIVERESPGGDIRKYFTEIYGGVDRSIKFDVGRSQSIRYTTAFEPMSMESLSELEERGIIETGLRSNQWYPTSSEILKWAERVRDKFPQTYCGAIGALHFTDDEEGGCTGFVIYNADENVMEWAQKIWIEEEDTNMRHPPSEFDMRTYEDTSTRRLPTGSDMRTYEDSPSDSNLIRMWWD